MSKDHKIFAAIDVGTSKTRLSVARAIEPGSIEIIALAQEPSEGIQMGLVKNMDKTVQALNLLSKQLDQKIEIYKVSVNLSGYQASKSFLKQASITRQRQDMQIAQEDVERLEEDVYKLVNEPGWSILHIIPQYYQVDGGDPIPDPTGMIGNALRAEFNIICSNNQATKNVDTCLERAGLQRESFVFSPIANSVAVLTEEEKEVGVCLVNIGAGITEVALFKENALRHATTIPFGGNIISSDIAKIMGIMWPQAEELKKQYGCELIEEIEIENRTLNLPVLKGHPVKEIDLYHLIYVIKARVEEIIALVYAEIKASGAEYNLGAGIVLTGGGAQINGISELFHQKTKYHTRIGSLCTEPFAYISEEMKDPTYAQVIGILISEMNSSGHALLGKQNIQKVKSKGIRKKTIYKILGGFKDLFKDEDQPFE
ncbi:MAG: cell division protein FtsA [Cytophagales bacterium]|nr:cell division protein FtsA [Cytophagales bacterium]